MKFRVIGSAILMIALAATSASAEGKMEKRAKEHLAKIMQKYEKTGETKHCVPLRFLRDSSIIDDQTIFFSGLGNIAYMNRLPHACPRLAQEGRFAYKVWIGQLCSTDIITVLDSFGREWASCGLGQFEVMKRKPKGDDAKKGEDKGAGQDGEADANK
ncbi:hypothetical protein [Kordiimonas marina]|uniref:hypothetical protein n=1 Tax=Kordiimonas marina TaxID=2872312 RepID=UPI001FF68344|nr:hypothetical protein [Kordiimonas marina]MCJ9427940.1 hypothetical protein [Kordiimonas marina]